MNRMPTRSILIGYDGTEHSDRALRRAHQYASELGAKLIVVTAELPVVTAVPPGLIAPVGAEYVPLKDVDVQAEDVIAQARELAGGAEHIARVGTASEVILDVADELDVDLIVVGTHEPGFLERLLRGSVSQHIARKATRDVLIVH